MSEFIGMLKLDPVTYTVEKEDLPDLTVGRASYHLGKIQVDTEMTGPQALATLLHEIIHLFLIHDGITVPDDIEEMLCDTIAMGLLRLIRDNPSMLDLFVRVQQRASSGSGSGGGPART